jgi:NDP-sugar pyrophosphorylase family protein
MSSSEQLFQRIAPDVKLGQRVKIFAFTNLYGCEIGDDSRIGAFVEIQKGARWKPCKISSHSFLCEGVTVEDEVFIGHGVTFINDRFPRATNADGNSRPRRTGSVFRQQSSGGLDRLRRDDSVRGGDWGTGDGGRRQCGDERCSGRRGCRRQPCAAAASRPCGQSVS